MVNHGHYAKAAIEEIKWLKQLILEANEIASEIIG
jgi:hypothetical protein